MMRSILLQLPILVPLSIIVVAWAQQQDPMKLTGGSILAMAGKQAVAIAVDKRFGSGPQAGT